MKSQSKHKGSHEINRLKMCLFCQKKPTAAFPVAGVIKTKIESKFTEFNAADVRLPKVICNPCRHKLLYSSTNTANITLPDYDSYQQVVAVENEDCNCNLCDKVRSRCSDISLIGQKKIAKSSKIETVKRCVKCFNKIGRGIKHKCGIKNLAENFEE